MKTEDIKRMALAWKEVQEAAKKKLDPVGKADADIDNDGDTDKSDAYLHNRRKAVSAAIKGKSSKGTTKEVVTSESSESKLDSFLKGMKDGKLHAATKKRKPTQYVMKDKKDVQKEEVEQIDELSKKTLGSYVKKASRNLAGREYKRGAEKDASTSNLQKSYKRDMGIAKAVDKITKEEVEQIDELKKSTLGSYVKKASGSMAGKTAVAAAQASSSMGKSSPDIKRGIVNRMKGITRATDRLTKEEAEIEEKKLTPKEIKAALGAAKAKPKDKVSVAKAPWDMKKEGTKLGEAATASISGRPGVASPPDEGISPNGKKELNRKTPMPDYVNEPAIDKKNFDAIRKSGPTAPYKAPGDKNIINKPLDITAKASKKEDDGFKDT